MRVRRSKLTRSAYWKDTGDAHVMSYGVPLDIHGRVTNTIVEDNLVEEQLGYTTPWSYGIEIVPGQYGWTESFTDTIVRRNRVINFGQAGLAVASWVRGTIENNVFVCEQAGISPVVIDVSLHGRDQGGPYDVATTGVIVRNNSIYVSSAVTAGRGILFINEGTGYIVENNVIHYLGIGDVNHNGWAAFDMGGLTADKFVGCDYNIADFPNAAAGKWEQNIGSLAAWRAARIGLDVNSQQLDPRLTSPGTPDFDLLPASGSPLISAANVAYSSTNDVLRLSRDATSDIGAYERGAADTTAPTINAVSFVASTTTAVVTWVTDKIATSSVDYGATSSYGSTRSATGIFATPDYTHTVTLTGLVTGTLYHFRCNSTDLAGHSVSSTDTTLRTF